MSALQTLTAVRELLSDPRHWCRSYYAEDAAGCQVLPGNAGACKFCVRGGVHRVLDSSIADEEAIRVCAIIEEAHRGEPLASDHEFKFVGWQDAPGRTHAEVLALLDKAIVLAKSREAES